MGLPDEAQLKTEIENIASRIDKIVTVVKQYYPEPNERTEADDSDASKEENQQTKIPSSDQEA